MRLAIALTAMAIVATLAPGETLELQRGGEPWRLVTCHFAHWTHEQLVWDGLAFAALGIACARRNRRAFHTTLLASVFVVPAAVFLFSPEIDSYRGLSGIASAMFACLLVENIRSERRPWLAMTVALAFFVKIAFETVTGSTLFVQDLGEGVVAVPVAHLAGAIAGGTIAFFATRGFGRGGSDCSELGREGIAGRRSFRRPELAADDTNELQVLTACHPEQQTAGALVMRE